MDRSYLSNENVIAASRNYVCIRLATYEDDAEAEFLRTVYVSRGGDLENTVFVLLSPDTKENLCRPGRGPQFAYSSPRALAQGMDEIAKDYEPKAREPESTPRLPQLKNVRLGLNVSSCDGLPSIVCVAKNDSEAVKMQATIAPLAFSNELAGRFVYSTTTEPDELNSVEEYTGKTGFLMIEPGEFGVNGKLISRFSVETEVDEIKTAMISYANGVAKVKKNHSAHVRKGIETGQNWETEIPVEDQGSLKAMEHMKRRSQQDGPVRSRSTYRGN